MVIIETSYEELYDGFEEFKEDWVKEGVDKHQLKKKYDLSERDYQRWRRHAIKETGHTQPNRRRRKQKTDEELRKILPHVLDDYIDDMEVITIKVKYNLSPNEWVRLRTIIKDEYGYVRPRRRGKLPKYISREGHFFRVQKTVDGKQVAFGKFNKKSTAFKIMKAMEKANWDESKYWEVRAEVLGV